MVYILLLFMEVIFYVQMKAQVKLFIAGKVIDFQEKQLMNMLDTVPDKVLVCTIERHDKAQSKHIFNNRQMNDFFGESFVRTGPPKKVKNAAKNWRKRVVRQEPFHKRIFRQRESTENDTG